MEQAPEMPAPSRYDGSTKAWRPFQLAYILMCLESVIDHESDHRETVDLIWASTGAGKLKLILPS